VISDLPLALMWALPRRRAQALAQRLKRARGLARGWQALSHPVSAWLWFALALWVWHAPSLYQAALRDDRLHALEHLIFLVTALLFWYVLLKQTGPNHRRYGVAVPYLFTTSLHSGVLAALMTFTSEPWYPYYASRTALGGLTPLQDQQMAGLVMWLPGGALFSVLTIVYFGAWFQALSQRSARRPRPAWLPLRQETD
jgi:putative membrane protein